MDQTLPRSRSSEVPSIDSAFNLGQPLAILVLLSMTFLVMIASIRTAAKSQSAAPSPMLAFADVFPGQPQTAVQAREFSCSVTEYNLHGTPTMEHCVLNPTSGTFSAVKLIVSENVVSLIRFVFRENTFRVGDFVLLLGRPRIHGHGQWTYFTWYSSGITATVHQRIITAHSIPNTLALNWISFTDTTALYQILRLIQ